MHKMYQIVFLYFFISLFLLFIIVMLRGHLGYVSGEPEDTKISVTNNTNPIKKEDNK